MKIIMKLVELIDDELSGAKEYIKLAMRERTEHPGLADCFADLADAEMGHVKALHSETEKLIEAIRQRDGEPPADMLAVYRYEHNKQVKCATKIKQMIADYHNDN